MLHKLSRGGNIDLVLFGGLILACTSFKIRNYFMAVMKIIRVSLIIEACFLCHPGRENGL
jgi:hypothetical protein